MTEQKNTQNYGHKKNVLGGSSLSSKISMISLIVSVLGVLIAINYDLFNVALIVITTWSSIFYIYYRHTEKKQSGVIKKMSDSLISYLSLIGKAVDGMEETFNSVSITHARGDDGEEYYHLKFEKTFVVTSDTSPTRYKGQFYVNKHLADYSGCEGFYNQNGYEIKWDDLEVKASIKYKKPCDEGYTPEIPVIVKNKVSGGYLIPFDVCFERLDNGSEIELPCGTKFELKYCYGIQRKLWGTYINRSMGFFAPETIVRIKYNARIGESFLKCNVSRLVSPNDKPVDYNDFLLEEINHGNEKEIMLKIKTIPFSKYRVCWNAHECFGGEKNTKDGPDPLGVTNR